MTDFDAAPLLYCPVTAKSEARSPFTIFELFLKMDILLVIVEFWSESQFSLMCFASGSRITPSLGSRYFVLSMVAKYL